MICHLCNREFKTDRSFINHFNHKHKDDITQKEYFDKYIKGSSKCVQCGETSNFISILKGYKNTCSQSCTYKYNCVKKYGVDHPNKDLKVKEEYLKKVKATKLERYGDEKFNNPKKHKETIKQNPHHYADIVKKVKATKLKKYGDANFNNIEKHRKTLQEKYGVSHNSENPSTILKRFKTFRKNHFDEFVSLLKLKKIDVLFGVEEYIANIEDGTSLPFKCHCGFEFSATDLTAQHVFCEKCKKQPYSVKEKQLADFVAKHFQIETNKKFFNENRKRFEVDIFIPEKNIGIEFNGVYWHSELFKNSKYHQEKHMFFKELGIELIQVWEFDWDEKQDIVLSILSHRLGLKQKRIFARKCELKEIPAKEYKAFLQQNHIQGSINSSIKYGLFHEGLLVSVFGLGKSRFKKNRLELHRFCSLKNHVVVGGFSKFLKRIETEVETYCDLSYFNGEGYKAVGFKEMEVTKPNYVYFKRKELKTRFQCQKHKLGKFLERFDPSLSEHQNMLNNGYLRMHDVGNMKLVFKK